jgi:hypothetical protein
MPTLFSLFREEAAVWCLALNSSRPRLLVLMAQNVYSHVYIRHLHDIQAQLTTDAGSEGSE